ncbi:hypothetical protein B0A55_01241 [Friedmanniomyces simplex]|uniref:Uncharacterized protein n=1 Tax=Friedmanniomyces simplex TaxID=329884 RepID=A0A4V5NID3_9PEZI|nr:hypothetical protein B0A55_01241 [Friedmanniomyces simplex]
MSTTEAKAWTYTAGYPASLQQTTILAPRAGEVKSVFTTPHILVKINACALNPVDIQMMNLPFWRLPGYNKPKTCVCDFSGTVITGGRTDLKRGDEVFGMTIKPFEEAGGALAEVAQFNMANSVAVVKPKEWSHEKAAGVSLVWLTAKACIENVAKFVDATSTKRVAVLGGSSATGMYTVMLAKQRGWKVVTTSSSRNKEFCIETLKADEHVDYTQRKVRAGVQKFAPDAVIDCVGGTECIGLPSSKRYVSIVGDKTGRTSMGGPATYYNFLGPFALYHATLQWDWPDAKHLTKSSEKKHVYNDFKDFGPTVQKIIDLLEPNLDCWAIFDTGAHPMPAYSKGRVCCLGDAGHATSPHHGAGAGICIEDAAVMAELLAEPSVAKAGTSGLEAAFQAFSDCRKERTQWLVQSSRRTGDLYEWRAEGVGNDVEKIHAECKERDEKIWDSQIEEMVAEAKQSLAAILKA